MIDVEFSSELVHAMSEHRTPVATALFQLFTWLGEIEGYILVVAAIYGAFDKRLAIRLAVLALVTMSINHVMKTIIANPRPFVSEGSFAERWAVSEAKAAELTAEYSTPSGHAMAGGSFYAFLFASVKSRWVKVLAVAALLLTGISRPYLGVHYVEDILLGWPLGIALAVLALRYGDGVGHLWLRLSAPKQGLIVVSFSALLVAGTAPLYAGAPHGQPLPFVSYLGLLSGLAMAYPLEVRWVDFDPRSSTPLRKLVRVALGIVLVMGTLLVLDLLFATISSDGSILGNVLRYLRYFTAGLVGMLAAPYLYVRIGWADTAQPGAVPDESRCVRVPDDLHSRALAWRAVGTAVALGYHGQPDRWRPAMEMTHEFVLSAKLKPPLAIGAGPIGTRMYYEVTSGEVRGDRLRGSIEGGGEWALIGLDGFLRVDVRLQIQTHDAAFIYVQYTGLLELNDAVQGALASGGGTHFGDQYFFTNPRLETGDERYDWVNTTFFVGQGRVLPDLGVEYRVSRLS